MNAYVMFLLRELRAQLWLKQIYQVCCEHVLVVSPPPPPGKNEGKANCTLMSLDRILFVHKSSSAIFSIFETIRHRENGWLAKV